MVVCRCAHTSEGSGARFTGTNVLRDEKFFPESPDDFRSAASYALRPSSCRDSPSAAVDILDVPEELVKRNTLLERLRRSRASMGARETVPHCVALRAANTIGACRMLLRNPE